MEVQQDQTQSAKSDLEAGVEKLKRICHERPDDASRLLAALLADPLTTLTAIGIAVPKLNRKQLRARGTATAQSRELAEKLLRGRVQLPGGFSFRLHQEEK